MTEKDVYTILQSTGIPFRYFKWNDNESVSIPFGVYYFPSSSNFAADGIVYKQKLDLSVEIYTEIKDFSVERKIESVFQKNGWVWQKSETYIESEMLYMVTYETEVFIYGPREEQGQIQS